MSDRRVLVMSTIMGTVGVLVGMAIGQVRAQRIDAAFATGTFQISAGNQSEAWRVNTSTGETQHCSSAQAGASCRRAEFK